MSRLSQLSAQHAHRYAFEGTLLERVLLTIIKAHPAPGSDWQDYERLRVAMAALTGEVKRWALKRTCVPRLTGWSESVSTTYATVT